MMSGGLSMYDTTLNQETSSSGTNSSLDTQVSGSTKKLARGISRATENASIVSHARLQLVGIDTPEYTFSLPDLSIYPDDFRQFLEKDLIDQGCLTSLESAGRLNWWSGGRSRVLWPLATTGDGNCLLHAASLGMWGYHDRQLKLREALHTTLTKGEFKEALFRRWKWRQMALNAASGLSYSESEWKDEWQSIVDMASINTRYQTETYQSLEEMHIFALSHVLRRPIIVIAETMLKDSEGDALAPIPFGGIYLPLEVSPDSCHRTPLLLAYHSAHFSPLVTVDSNTNPNDISSITEGICIPLVDPDTGQLFPVPFAVDPGPDWDWAAPQDLLPCPQDTMEILIKEYLECEYHIFHLEDPDRISELDGSVRNRTSKQLFGVAKQFGSIGKSVSKFWSMTKRPKSPAGLISSVPGECFLTVKMRINRHKYVDQMLQNYLESAHARYVEDNKNNVSEMNYGAGKSKFYAACDTSAHASLSKIPITNPNKDQTLYLSRSTFYNNSHVLPIDCTADHWKNNDSLKGTVKPCRTMDCKFFGSSEHQYYCSQCWASRNHL